MTPTQQYATLEEGSPVVQFVHQGSQCAGGLHLKAQKYRGETYLTYWMGNNELDPPVGAGYMHFNSNSAMQLDNSYRERHQIQPVGYPAADKHEFHVTQDGTAIVIVYSPVLGDLSPVGGTSGWVLDGIFQEIDIETGALLFEWHALQHFPLNTTFHDLDSCGHRRCGSDPSTAFDFFHINSMDKTPTGDYLISSRHTHSVISIDASSGAVQWHDARWRVPDMITLFNNSAKAENDRMPEARGIALKADVPAHQVWLQAFYRHPSHRKSGSRGNVDILPSGNVLVGWGHSAAYTEYTADGTTILCSMHFSAFILFSVGLTNSYRIFKDSGVGQPLTDPPAVVVGRQVFVSWNGAMEVAKWRLEVLDGSDQLTFHPVVTVPRQSFETAIALPSGYEASKFRVVALGEGNEEQAKWIRSNSDSTSSLHV
ncbi:hypothetical protein BO86DRAFT_439752 [Aspergillus japonicus CBS 114.51]|uniref:Arylsulfotransferase n=1 Tax=Aspergillus japonicus CBS 114.51 TaxID=1448312 RepID=A0A8T8WPZ6_ASPJA|nr:hypothetical protein BO86DRAFT_439752 [Aspergillus japonicus CBS 114.51]RAH77861.1 hypothetical protein BO86DRAFT_439752 [Aspergillus japonicus CBS 114.51]